MALLLFSSLNFCSLFPFRPTSKAWIFSQVVCAAPTNRFFDSSNLQGFISLGSRCSSTILADQEW
ncbi:hypothetical protein GLYMA_13G293000v4 [Glycine max]|nr:hypothetical protein GLYMA_13G293000v4 [Glycine max]